MGVGITGSAMIMACVDILIGKTIFTVGSYSVLGYDRFAGHNDKIMT